MDYKNVHFIGIGGIGMSALARMLCHNGVTVSGSDISASEITDSLKKEGINIFIDQVAHNIGSQIDCVVYTIAVKDDNAEFQEAKRRNLPIFTYAEMLGKVSDRYFTIAISGTHGKTTTTAMITEVFQGVGLDPTAIVGSLLSASRSNFVSGGSKFFIVEACEYGRSFHNLNPKILVITNVEEDHLDYYKDLEEIKQSFKVMAHKIPADGFIICDPDDHDIKDVISGARAKIVNYKNYLQEIPELTVPGKHNRLNASCALAVARCVINPQMDREYLEKVKQALSLFKGTWRRLEYLGKTINGAMVFDDYAHHPSEIKCSLMALKEKYPDKKILAIFQPHLYSRTKLFLKSFAEVLRQFSDRLIVLPIYAAREKNDPEIDSIMIIEEVSDDKAEMAPDFFETTRLALDKNVNDNWIIITLGAGDVFRVARMLSLQNIS